MNLTIETVLNDLTGFIDFLVYSRTANDLDFLRMHVFECCKNTGNPYHLIESDGFMNYEQSDYLELPDNDNEKEIYIDVLKIIINQMNKENIDYNPPKRATPEQYAEWVKTYKE